MLQQTYFAACQITSFLKKHILAKKLLIKHFLDYSKVALPGDYLEEEKEEDDDDGEKNTNVEQSPGKIIETMTLSCKV